MAFDIYKAITDKVIAELEKGIIPWEKPWIAPNGCGAFNRISKKSYSFLNQMLLGKPGEWATMKQWNELGGKIRKGEHPSMCVFYKRYPKSVTRIDEETGEAVEKDVSFGVLRYYNVFHISQVDGVEPLKFDDEPEDKNKPLKKAEHIMKAYSTHEEIKISRCRSDQAYYSPAKDKIVLPAMKYFNSSEAFYDTAFHEMTHSTGHKTRLDRISSDAAFGNEEYSKEELVAEIGSAALAHYVGTETEKTERNNVAYIQGWLSRLKSDTKFLTSAAGKAEKAVEYILDAVAKHDNAEAAPSV